MDKDLLGQRIKQRRKELDMTQGDIANSIGVAVSTVQRYETAAISKIKLPVVEAIARTLHVNPNWLAGKTDNPEEIVPHQITYPIPTAAPIDTSKLKRIPILGKISAGVPIYAEENIEGYTYTDLNGGHEYFALRVRGDSMNALGINDGYIIVVRKQESVDNGDVAVVLVDMDSATVKRFYQTDNTVTLMPQSLNPAHKPQIYDLATTNIQILGKVVKVEFTL